MLPALTLALIGATLETEARLVTRFGAIDLDALGPGVRAALEQLVTRGGTEDALAALVRERGGPAELAALFYYLRIFDGSGQLSRTLTEADSGSGSDALIRVIPISPGYAHAAPALDLAAPLRLSRFALIRRFRGGMVLESPRTHARIELLDPRALALLHGLATAQGSSASALASPLAAPLQHALLRLLLGTGHLCEVADDVEDSPTLAMWSFHDLVFHARSRAGRHDLYNGKTFPFADSFGPLPAVRPLPQGPTIMLPRPPDSSDGPDRAHTPDNPGSRSFTAVLDARHSVRAQAEAPIDLATLATFLFRSARVRHLRPAASARDYETSNRVAPGGGGCHELELYLAIDRCADLDSGLYHYDPHGHRLTRVRERDGALERLLADTRVATGSEQVSQVLVCVAARFGRMAWPYEGIVYATTLKNVGALLQTMYLVGTDMGLATCAVGRGDADLFAALAGTDYYAETTVGEFMLGTRARS